MDLGLPKKSGLDVLKRLRASDSRLPVLILTALDGVSDRVRGLDAGADDYLAKPFDLAELEARVRALTRRGMSGGPTLLNHGALKYDQVGRVASLNGEGPAGIASVRVGRGSVAQRDRGLRASPAARSSSRAASASSPCAASATASKNQRRCAS